ncbi:MAG: hypothetical protein EON59_04755 [Alphaproteobacteria bacterium]|nr:MAG: hypothetical protein EON59_04755 [Alphaproteobacteria bacterium]
MATLKPIGFAEIHFLQLLMPERLDRRGVERAFYFAFSRLRYGGLSPRQRWLKCFDPAVRDLSTLAIGVFDQKMFVLPRQRLPKSEPELIQLCRRLIDRGEDENHIAIMLRSWPAGFTVEDHARALWNLRQNDRLFYEDVVRGRHGRALSRIAGKTEVGGLPLAEAKRLLARHALLWCAMDVQMTVARARVSFTAPVGKLLSTAMKVVKAGTVLRLMNNAYIAMSRAFWEYQTGIDEEEDGKKKAKPSGKSKTIAFYAKEAINAKSKALADYRKELDQSIPELRGDLGQLSGLVAYCKNFMTEKLQPRIAADGTVEKRDNTLRHFHPIWFSNLSPAAGMAVALFRFATAERHIEDLVNQAAAPAAGGNLPVQQVEPLPALPQDLDELALMIERVLDLSDSARRVQLRDVDWRSRTKIGLTEIKKALEAKFDIDPILLQRDPLDKAGLTFVNDARRFLMAMGQRQRDAYDSRHSHDDRHFTYWHMDVVPEYRLSI